MVDNSALISQLTREYGRVHLMSMKDLKLELSSYDLDTRGDSPVLQKRLKEHLRRSQAMIHPQISSFQKSNPHSHYAVIDFEATCDDSSSKEDFMHEIIEVPVVLIDVRAGAVVDIFHEYVKPTMCPQLTAFCKKLTGINQTTINQSKSFVEVWKMLEVWLSSKNIESLCFITDGPWDFRKFLAKECRYNNLEFPAPCVQYCNIRRKFCNFYGVKRASISGMLNHLGLQLEGKLHSGISDAKNIANIAMTMLRDGAVLTHNEAVDPGDVYTA